MGVQQARAALANGTIKLTDKGVRDLPTPLKGSVIYTDGGILEVRVTAAGAYAWVYRYRHNGRSVTYTIGDPVNMKASRASKEADRLYELVRQGRDPQGERRAAREAPTVKELCARYLEEHAARKRSAAEDRRMIDKVILPALGARKVAEIEFADLDQLHRRLTTKGTPGHGRGAPYMANRVVSLLSKMFSLAIQWKLRSDNPAKGIGRNAEAKRKRYLSDDEIPRLRQALAEYPHQQSANAIRLLMLTGARRMEVLSATWDQVDLSRGARTKPNSATKDKREHTIPLSAPALELLSEMKAEAKSEYLFPGRGVDHLSDLKKPWAVIAKNAKLDGVRVHDLRHSFASILVSSGRDARANRRATRARIRADNPAVRARRHQFAAVRRRRRRGQDNAAAESRGRADPGPAMTPDQLLKEWEAADPRDFGQLIRWLTFFARQYEKAKKTAERRFWILQQLDFLTRFGKSLCANDQLKPVRRLMLALIGLDRGVESPILTPRYWAYPKPIAETLFRARMAAAVQMYHETGKRISPSSVSLVITQAKRQMLEKARSRIGAKPS